MMNILGLLVAFVTNDKINIVNENFGRKSDLQWVPERSAFRSSDASILLFDFDKIYIRNWDMLKWKQWNREFPNSKREFPGISKIMAEITGIYGGFVLKIFIVDYYDC